MQKYLVVHKLTNKPIRELQSPYNVVTFDLISTAMAVRDMKNNIMKADFYKVCTQDTMREIK